MRTHLGRRLRAALVAAAVVAVGSAVWTTAADGPRPHPAVAASRDPPRLAPALHEPSKPPDSNPVRSPGPLNFPYPDFAARKEFSDKDWPGGPASLEFFHADSIYTVSTDSAPPALDAVPEPTSLTLLSMGIVGLLLRHRA